MQVAIGSYDHTKGLKDGSISAPGMDFDFVEVSPITRAFRAMATQQAYDLAEMALVTYMLARVYNKPIVGLPIVLVRSSLLPGLVTSASSSSNAPSELNGKTLGIRSYTQTSGVWVRGILQDGFGVDLSSLKWVTFEGSHLDEYADPANVSRAPEGANTADMVKDGSLFAAIGLPASEGLRPYLADPAAAEAEWAKASGVRTVNHILTLKQSLVDADPALPAKITDLFERARSGDGAAVPPIGVEPNRKAFETLARYAYEQKVTPKQFSLEELFPTAMARA
jgi:4,5-dihydroxyphthalate decarboxylase